MFYKKRGEMLVWRSPCRVESVNAAATAVLLDPVLFRAVSTFQSGDPVGVQLNTETNWPQVEPEGMQLFALMGRAVYSTTARLKIAGAAAGAKAQLGLRALPRLPVSNAPTCGMEFHTEALRIFLSR